MLSQTTMSLPELEESCFYITWTSALHFITKTALFKDESSPTARADGHKR